MRCEECGIKIPEMPEDATYDMLLCDRCNKVLEWTEKSELEGRLIAGWIAVLALLGLILLGVVIRVASM